MSAIEGKADIQLIIAKPARDRVPVHADACGLRLLLPSRLGFPVHHHFRPPRCVHELGNQEVSEGRNLRWTRSSYIAQHGRPQHPNDPGCSSVLELHQQSQHQRGR
jgi:hypothetical protein